MNNAELKEALLQRSPVRFNGIRYAGISAIIYRAENGSIKVTAELMDITERSITIADPAMITLDNPTVKEASTT